MKYSLVLALVAIASAQTLAEFREWAKLNNKVYTAFEEARRFAIFKENAAIAERLHIEGHGAVFGQNVFADLTNAEFKALYTTKILGSEKVGSFVVVEDNLTASADYSHYLPAVKDQGQCGSCWAFSAVANAEGQYYQSEGKVLALSEQELVSCDKGLNMGCNGGNMYYASQYAVKHGLASEAAYPYKSASGVAPACKTYTAVAQFSKAVSLGSVSSDSSLIKYLDEYGPLSVAIEADASVFQLYTSGVLDSSSCGTSTNHGVTLVGYGTDATTGKNFWNVRNSWGASWGAKGYVKMVRGKNMCGINSQISTIVA